MSDAEPPPLGYANTVDLYWEAGWKPLPILRGRKGGRDGKLPSGYTGRGGVDPSYADVMQWKETRPDDNILIRMPPGVMGIDVDAYDSKTGAAALAEAEQRWGKLPPTVRSTSRTDPNSGIRLYRIPEGVELKESINFGDLGIGDIETVQHHHRYAVCWPSIHPEGRTYRWLDDHLNEVPIPHLSEIPDLPPAWLAALKAEPRVGGLDAPVDYDVKKALTGGDMSAAVRDRLQGAIRELSTFGVCHHDCVRKHSLALLHLGKAGEAGVLPALETLGAVFVNSVRDRRDGGEQEATAEYRSMVLGPGVVRSLGQRGILDWAMPDDLVNPPPPPGVEEQAAAEAGGQSAHTPSAETAVPGNGSATQPERALAADPPPAATQLPAANPSSPNVSHLEEIERGFWEERDSLHTIYEASLSRMCSPWSVLAFCVARTLHQVRPHWRLPPVIGGPGSLNWFAAIVDKSGGGKTISKSLASELVTGDVYSRNLGSGEGITTAFHKPSTKKNEPPERHEAVHFDVDEVSIITGLAERNGSTTMSVLKSAFSGDTLGFSYVSRDVHVAAHAYRMTMVVGVQPRKARALLDDEGGGFPQRFMWFPANDSRCTEDRQSDWIPGPIVLPRMDGYPRTLTIPDEAKRELIVNRAKNARGETDALDGHALFCREKFAYALAVLDGRDYMNDDDWYLSGIAADVSTFTRVSMIDELNEARIEEAREKGKLLGIQASAANAEKIIQDGERLQKVIRWVFGRLEKEGPQMKRDFTHSASRASRPWIDAALEELQRTGLVGFADGKWMKL